MNRVEIKAGDAKVIYEYPEDIGLMQVGATLRKLKNAITNKENCDATVYIKDKKYIVTLTKNGLVRKG